MIYILQVSTKIEDGKLVMEFVPKNQGEGKTVRQTRHIENGELILVRNTVYFIL